MSRSVSFFTLSNEGREMPFIGGDNSGQQVDIASPSPSPSPVLPFALSPYPLPFLVPLPLSSSRPPAPLPFPCFCTLSLSPNPFPSLPLPPTPHSLPSFPGLRRVSAKHGATGDGCGLPILWHPNAWNFQDISLYTLYGFHFFLHFLFYSFYISF